MNDSYRGAVKPLAVRLAFLAALASLAVSSSAYAINFGHSRLLSPVGQPLKVQVPVHQLTAQERNSLSMSVAPETAWKQAGLTPPVPLSSLQVAIVDGVRPGSKMITVRSNQALASPVADLLLHVRSSSGQLQHQVSLLAPANLEVARASGGISTPGAVSAVGSPGDEQPSIQIRRGDTLFALARRHAVPGVSVYQWMIGVMQANPEAFINDNVNLIKAGATLSVPDQAGLMALSDRQAREIFQRHATAFAQYRQRVAGQVARSDTLPAQTADRGQVSASASKPAPGGEKPSGDRLVLQSEGRNAAVQASPSSSDNQVSGAGEAAGNEQGDTSGQPGVAAGPTTSDEQLALQGNTQETRERINQLEGNVRTLNQALQQQGSAAHEAVVKGAKAVEETVEQLTNMVSEGSDVASEEGGQGLGETGSDSNASVALTGASGTASANLDNGSGTSGSGSSASGSTSSGGASGAGSVSASTASSSSGLSVPGQSGQKNDIMSTASAAPAASATTPDTEQADKQSATAVSWVMNNLLILISGALAIIVLIVAWLLRRVGAERDDDTDAVITEEMVRERLQSINLDLDDTAPTDKTDTRT